MKKITFMPECFVEVGLVVQFHQDFSDMLCCVDIFAKVYFYLSQGMCYVCICRLICKVFKISLVEHMPTNVHEIARSCAWSF